MMYSAKLKMCPVCGGKLRMQIYLDGFDGHPMGNVYCIMKCMFPTRYFHGVDSMNEVVEELKEEST